MRQIAHLEGSIISGIVLFFRVFLADFTEELPPDEAISVSELGLKETLPDNVG